MTFSEAVKKECARLDLDNECCSDAELAAFLRMSGVLELGGQGKLGVSLRTENPATARRMFKLVRKVSSLKTQVFVRKKMRLKKNYTYLVSIYPSHHTLDFLVSLGMMTPEKSIVPGIDDKLVKKRCCQRAYLRGCFLAAGAVSDPKKGSYHCELLTYDAIHADDLLKLLTKQGLQGKYIERKVGSVVYLKDSQQITEFLSMIGAHSASLDYESARVYRSVRNRVNRLVNSETANLNKTLNASWRQVQKIKFIEEQRGLDILSLKLKEVAQARLANPELSLSELAEKMDYDLSKSAVNHRLRKIEQIADELEEEIAQMGEEPS